MRDVKIFASVAVGFLVLMYILFFTGNWAPVPGLGFILGTMAVLMGWVSLKLTNKWKSYTPEEQQRLGIINELRWFFIVGTIFFFLDIIPHALLPIIRPDRFLITLTHWVAHLFLFVDSVLAARVAVSFFNPSWKNAITVIVALLGMTALTASIVNPDTIIRIPTSKYPLIQSSRTFAWFNMLANATSFGFAGVYLLVRGLMSKVPVARTRAILIALGMLSEPIVGLFIQFGRQILSASVFAYLPAILYTFFTTWALFLGIGALYTAEKKEPAVIPGSSAAV